MLQVCKKRYFFTRLHHFSLFHSFTPLQSSSRHTRTHRPPCATRQTTIMSAVVDFVKKTHEDAIVKVEKNVAIAAMLLNVFFPGIGTLVACIVADKTMEGLKCFACMWLMCLVFFVGWVWSIWHGVLILKKALSEK